MSKKSITFDDEDFLFSQNVLKALDFSNASCFKKNKISVKYPGENLIMRPLCKMDYHKDYTTLMSELTTVGNIDNKKFTRRFREMKECNSTYYICVIEDTSLNKIVGSGTLVIEKHLDRKVRIVTRGRVEDIVVSNSHRGRQLGKLILDTLVLLGDHVGCDEISLECKDHLIKFYNQFGFVLQSKQKYMTYYVSKNNSKVILLAKL